MSFSAVVLRTMGALAFGLFTMASSPAIGQEASQKYTEVLPAQPSDTVNKTEVLEFFSYNCPHCAAIEPLMQTWAEKQPDTIAVRQVPVAFNRAMADYQRLYYTLESLDRLDLHPKFFDALHKERKRITSANDIADWAAEQGIDRKKFVSTFKSFGVDTKVKRADALAGNYDVDSTPTIAVGGRYITSPALAGGYQQAVDETQRLLDQLGNN